MGKLSVRFYDLENPLPDENELRRYAEQAGRAKGPILEAMCGSGRLLIPLLNSGFRIDGLDASPHMLERCRAKLKGLDTNLYRQNMEEMQLPRKYDLIFIPARSLCLLREIPFQKLREHLNPGGALLFDIWSSMEPEPTVIRENRNFGELFSEKTFVYEHNAFSVHHRLQENEALEEESYQIRLYEKEEILDQAEKVGLTLVNDESEVQFAKIGDAIYSKKIIHFAFTIY